MNVISYVLFGTNALYWKNLPLILIANDLFYPKVKTRLYLHKDSRAIPIYGLLEEAQSDLFEIVLFEEEVIAKKHMIRRLLPLWEDGVSFLWSRDLDSVPHSEEVKANYVFMESNLAVHRLRSSKMHDRLMGGLSGFHRPSLTPHLPATFDKFIGSQKNYDHGWDQNLLSSWFFKLDAKTLDSPTHTATALSWSKAVVHPRSFYDRVTLDWIPKSFISLCDRISVFPGAVVSFVLKDLEEASRVGTKTANIVSKFLQSAKPELLHYWS